MTTDHPRDAPSDERLAAFAGQVSHDLKNPLAGIRMSLELAREELDPTASEALALLARAERGVARMDAMIDDLREFAQIGVISQRAAVPLAEAAERALADLGDAVAPGQVSGESGLPTVTGDPDQLQTLLRRLVANAVAVSAAESAIELAADRLAEGWRVSVSDRGRGTPTELRAQLFDPAVKPERSVAGNRIGLATCAAIVAVHGGRIGLDERPGGGAVVWFELPD